MAITEERLKEMEEEMNRFEEEISTVHPPMRPGAHKMIIGSGTFNQVQARLGNRDDSPMGPPGLPSRPPGPPGPPGSFPTVLPPPPPPVEMTSPNSDSSMSMRPPPPPPISRPAFVPHQIRHRPPPPPPPMSSGRPPFLPQGMQLRPSMSGPPRGMPPPPPPPMRGPGPHAPYMSGPGGMHMPPMHYNAMYPGPPVSLPMSSAPMSTQTTAPVIEAKKVVYSAPPVKNINLTASTTKSKPSEPVVDDKPNTTESESPTIPAMDTTVHTATTTTITNTAPEQQETQWPGEAAMETEESKKEKKEKKKKYLRIAAGQQWEDPTLAEWNTDDFRIFCGDLGNEVTDEVLARAFGKYPSFIKARVVRDKRTNKTRGYGFVSFKDPSDFVRAMREMNGKYVGNRPIKLRKSTWKDRQAEIVKKKEKEKKRLGFR